MNWKHCYHAFIFYGPWAALKPKIYNSNSQKSIFKLSGSKCFSNWSLFDFIFKKCLG